MQQLFQFKFNNKLEFKKQSRRRRSTPERVSINIFFWYNRRNDYTLSRLECFQKLMNKSLFQLDKTKTKFSQHFLSQWNLWSFFSFVNNFHSSVLIYFYLQSCWCLYFSDDNIKSPGMLMTLNDTLKQLVRHFSWFIMCVCTKMLKIYLYRRCICVC